MPVFFIQNSLALSLFLQETVRSKAAEITIEEDGKTCLWLRACFQNQLH